MTLDARLQSVLAHYPQLISVESVRPLGNAGGMSGASLYRLVADGFDYCLRAWPTAHPSPQQLRWIHTQMQCARDAGCEFVPRIFPSVQNATFVKCDQQLWELSEWKPGTANFSEIPSDRRLVGAVESLGRFHAAFDTSAPNQQTANSTDALAAAIAPASSLTTSPGIRDRLQIVCNLMDQDDFPTIQQRWLARIDARHGREIQTLAQEIALHAPPRLIQCRSRLRAAVELRVPLQTCLRDVWHDHILYVGDHVSGIVDYGAMRIASPAGDLARLLGSMVPDQPDRWHVALQAYLRFRKLSDTEEKLLAVFDEVNPVLAGFNWLTWLFHENRRFSEQESVVRRMTEIVQRLKYAAG